jgi:hypothetical protein
MEDELIYTDDNGRIERIDIGDNFRFLVTRKNGSEVWTNDLTRAHQLLTGKINTPTDVIEEATE